MKKISKIFVLGVLALALPLTSAICQEKKTEKKVKIIIDDGSGVRTIVDTTFINSPAPDSIVIKDGEVIYLNEPCKDKPEGMKCKKMTVTVTADNKDGKDMVKTIIVNGGDAGLKGSGAAAGDSQFYVISDAEAIETQPGKNVYVITRKADNDSEGIRTVAIMKDGKSLTGEEKLVEIEENGKNVKDDMTKYIVARDGMVVTVESNDEAKAKDLIKLIESNLDTQRDAGNANMSSKPAPLKKGKK
jgi:hypothetical protein